MLQPPGNAAAAAHRKATATTRRKTVELPDDVIRQLQRLPPNKKCADCFSKLPSCVNLTVGSFICMTCAGVHRELNARIKGVGHSSFTPEEAEMMKGTDNDKVNAAFLARYSSSAERIKQPVDNRDPQLVRAWIHRKYQDRAWYRNPEEVSRQPQPTVVQIPAKSPAPAQAQVDLFGADFSSPSHAAAPPQQGGTAWDAFGGSAAAAAPPAGNPFQANFANFSAPPPAPPQQQADFPADFGSSQNRQQQQPPPMDSQRQAAFPADFGSSQIRQQQPPPPAAGNPFQSFANFSPQKNPNDSFANMGSSSPGMMSQPLGMTQQLQQQPGSMMSQQHYGPQSGMANMQQPKPSQQQPGMMSQPSQQPGLGTQPQSGMMQQQPQQFQQQPGMQSGMMMQQQPQSQQQSGIANIAQQQPGMMMQQPRSQQQPGMANIPQQQPGMMMQQQPQSQQQPGMPHMGQQQPGMMMQQPQSQQQPGMPNIPRQQPGMMMQQQPQSQQQPGMLNKPQQQPGMMMQQQPQSQQQPGMPNMAQQQPGMMMQQQPQSQQQPGMPNSSQQQPGMMMQQQPQSQLQPGMPHSSQQQSGMMMQHTQAQQHPGMNGVTQQPQTQAVMMQQPFQSPSPGMMQQGAISPTSQFGMQQHQSNKPMSTGLSGAEAISNMTFPESKTMTPPVSSAADAFSDLNISTTNTKPKVIDNSADKTERSSKFKPGQKVYYKSESYSGAAEILKVHFDDHLEPFYTIDIQGKEKQTDDAHLELLPDNTSTNSPLQQVQQTLQSLSSDQLQKVLEFIQRLKKEESTGMSQQGVPQPSPITNFSQMQHQKPPNFMSPGGAVSTPPHGQGHQPPSMPTLQTQAPQPVSMQQPQAQFFTQQPPQNSSEGDSFMGIPSPTANRSPSNQTSSGAGMMGQGGQPQLMFPSLQQQGMMSPSMMQPQMQSFQQAQSPQAQPANTVGTTTSPQGNPFDNF